MILKHYTQVLPSKNFLKQYKNANIKVRKAFDKQFAIFANNPMNLGLRNHLLRNEWNGYRSIDITADWRAIYQEIHEGKELIAYFVALGTHKELYR